MKSRFLPSCAPGSLRGLDPVHRPAYDDDRCGQIRDASWDAIKAGLGAMVACIDDYGSATLEYKVDEVLIWC